MRAAAAVEFGSPEALRIIELEDPQAGPGEIRVRVRAAGIGPADCAVRRGWTLPGTTVELPLILGQDFAGTVDQVGEGVSGLTVGSDVLGFRTFGCHAEYLVVPANQAVKKPSEMPWAVAGAFPGGAQTAHTTLQSLNVGGGDVVLIHAAAGAVGTVAVQLARLVGATVIGTASERNHDYLRSLGAIPITYGDGLVERVRALVPGGVDAVVDTMGGDTLLASLELVKDRDRIGSIVDPPTAVRLGVRAVRSDRSATRLTELLEFYRRGDLRVTIWKTFPLEAVADAHREVETRHRRGKIVLIVDQQ
jgi:NADPH:quinone reductase-like Zn-dependent oxidoreductase